MIKTAILLFFHSVLITALIGCAFYGPPYIKPNVQTPQQWNSSDRLSKTDSTNLPTRAWWEAFEDKQLNTLVNKAVENNNHIQAAVGHVLAAQGEFAQIQMSVVPSISTLLLGFSAANVDLFIPGFNSGFLPTYALNLFQYIRSNEWARAKVQVAAAAKDTVTLTVISQTIGGYFTYLGQSYLLQQQKQLVADLKTLLLLSQQQYQQGLISLYTLQQYEQQYEQAKAELPVIANNVVLSGNALKLLLNENPGHIKIGHSFMRLKSNGIIPTNLPSQVLKNRPDVREAEAQLIAANANVGIVTSTFFPSITLINVAGSGSLQLRNLFSQSTDYWHNLTQLTMPALAPEFNGQYQTAMGKRYTAYRNYIQAVRAAFKAVDDDLSAHQRYYESLTAETKRFSSTKTAYDLAQMSYKKGLYSYPTLLINKITMDNAAIHLTKSKLAQLSTIVQLYQDLGSGYAYQCKAST